MKYLFYGNNDTQCRDYAWPFFPDEAWGKVQAQMRMLDLHLNGIWFCSGAPHDFFGVFEAGDIRSIFSFEVWYRHLEGAGDITFQPCFTRAEALAIVRGPDASDRFLGYDEYPQKRLDYSFVFCGAFDPSYKDYDWGFHVLEANKRCEKKAMELGLALEGIWLCTGGVYNYFGVIHSPSIENVFDWEQWYERMPGSGDIIFQIALPREKLAPIVDQAKRSEQ